MPRCDWRGCARREDGSAAAGLSASAPGWLREWRGKSGAVHAKCRARKWSEARSLGRALAFCFAHAFVLRVLATGREPRTLAAAGFSSSAGQSSFTKSADVEEKIEQMIGKCLSSTQLALGVKLEVRS